MCTCSALAMLKCSCENRAMAAVSSEDLKSIMTFIYLLPVMQVVHISYLEPF